MLGRGRELPIIVVWETRFPDANASCRAMDVSWRGCAWLQNYLLFITYLHWWERWILSAIPNATTAATPTPTTIAIFALFDKPAPWIRSTSAYDMLFVPPALLSVIENEESSIWMMDPFIWVLSRSVTFTRAFSPVPRFCKSALIFSTCVICCNGVCVDCGWELGVAAIAGL